MKKISMIKTLEGKKVTTGSIKLADIENEPVLISDAVVSKGDLGAAASFTIIRADGTNAKVTTYAWGVIDLLDRINKLEAFPVAACFVLNRGRWDMTDVDDPSIFDKFVTVKDDKKDK